MPNQSQNPSFHITEGGKDKTKTITKRIKCPVDDKKDRTSSLKNKKEDTQSRLNSNKKNNGAKNGKDGGHDANYREPFLFYL